GRLHAEGQGGRGEPLAVRRRHGGRRPGRRRGEDGREGHREADGPREGGGEGRRGGRGRRRGRREGGRGGGRAGGGGDPDAGGQRHSLAQPVRDVHDRPRGLPGRHRRRGRRRQQGPAARRPLVPERQLAAAQG